MRAFQGKKALSAVLLLTVLFLSSVWCSGELYGYAYSLTQSESGYSHRQELSSGDETRLLQAASASTLRASSEQSVTEREGCPRKQENRLYFISLFAVLFKIAVIPNIILVAVVTAGRHSSDVLCRLVQFLHDSDGKKEMVF